MTARRAVLGILLATSSSLALTASRMREDTIFRDAAHHFLRTFDKTFAAFERNASDAELVALADEQLYKAKAGGRAQVCGLQGPAPATLKA